MKFPMGDCTMIGITQALRSKIGKNPGNMCAVSVLKRTNQSGLWRFQKILRPCCHSIKVGLEIG